MVERVRLERQLDAIGWGAFFIWVGLALLLDVGWGIGLLGVGAITLCVQASRRFFGLGIEGFWAIVGLLFILGGVLDLAQTQLSIAPFLLVVAGVALLLSALRQK